MEIDRIYFGCNRGRHQKPFRRCPFSSATFSEMEKRKETRRKQVGVRPAEPDSATSSPSRGVGSPKQLTKEDQAKLIEQLQRKLDASSKKQTGNNKRSAIGAADSTTDEDDDPAEASEPAVDDAQPASSPKSGSTSAKFSKLGNRASKARKLFKDKDEEAEFKAWKASKASKAVPVAAVPVQPVVAVQSDEAIARLSFCSLLFFFFMISPAVATILRKLRCSPS